MRLSREGDRYALWISNIFALRSPATVTSSYQILNINEMNSLSLIFCITCLSPVFLREDENLGIDNNWRIVSQLGRAIPEFSVDCLLLSLQSQHPTPTHAIRQNPSPLKSTTLVLFAFEEAGQRSDPLFSKPLLEQTRAIRQVKHPNQYLQLPTYLWSTCFLGSQLNLNVNCVS